MDIGTSQIIALCFVLIFCAGCSSMRWGERSYEEVEQHNQEQRALDRVKYKPAEAFAN